MATSKEKIELKNLVGSKAKKNKDIHNLDTILHDYMIKTYYKTGSLISNACKGVALLTL